VRIQDLGGAGQRETKELNPGFILNYCKGFQLATLIYEETSLEKPSNAQQACPDNTLRGK